LQYNSKYGHNILIINKGENMIVSIIKGKMKNWEKHFKKEFGAYPPNATLQDVANDRVSMYGNHVDAFIKEKKNEPKKDVSGSGKVRQDNYQGKRFVDSPFKAEAEKEELGF
jgi:predicted SpoU family rRNA methylase